jgi:hypothetical protein
VLVLGALGFRNRKETDVLQLICSVSLIAKRSGFSRTSTTTRTRTTPQISKFRLKEESAAAQEETYRRSPFSPLTPHSSLLTLPLLSTPAVRYGNSSRCDTFPAGNFFSGVFWQSGEAHKRHK